MKNLDLSWNKDITDKSVSFLICISKKSGIAANDDYLFDTSALPDQIGISEVIGGDDNLKIANDEQQTIFHIVERDQIGICDKCGMILYICPFHLEGKCKKSVITLNKQKKENSSSFFRSLNYHLNQHNGVQRKKMKGALPTLRKEDDESESDVSVKLMKLNQKLIENKCTLEKAYSEFVKLKWDILENDEEDNLEAHRCCNKFPQYLELMLA